MSLTEQIREVIIGPHPAAVATLDDNQPAVRFMGTYRFSRHDPCRGYDEILKES